MDELSWLLLQIAITVALLVIMLGLLMRLRRTTKSVRLLLRGEHAEALPLCRAASKSWPRSLSLAGAYNVALCLHHLERLDEAEAALLALIAERPGGTVDGLAHGLLGATRVLGEMYGEETERHVQRGREVFAHSSDWLWLAHLALARGDAEDADSLIEKARTDEERPNAKIGWVSARVDGEGLRAMEGYLIGWYREKRGDRAAALAAYLQAAAAPRSSIYVHRSRAAVERLRREGVAAAATHTAARAGDAREDEDGPGSLGPFVSD